MKDESKSKQQLLNELNKLKQRVSEFDASEMSHKKTLKELQKSHDKLEKKIEEQRKELEGINERLRIIVESAQRMTVFSEIDKMGELLLKEFARAMAAEGGSIYKLENNRLILDYSLDPGHASDSIPLPLKKGTVLEKALKKKKPILIKDIEKEKNTLKSGWSGYRDGSVIVFPISDEEGEVTAVIALHNKKTPPFVEQDKEIGFMLASYSCEALQTIKSNQALIESEKLLKNILSASSVGIAYARNRVVVWANEAMEKMFGFEDEKEYLGKTTYQIYASEEEYERVGKIIYEGIETGKELMETDVKLKRTDGTTFDGHARVSFINPSNPLQGIIVSIIDITERKQAEELLRESEEKYRNLFENSIETVFTVDLEGNFTSINRATEMISGYSRDELIGKNAFDFMKPEFSEEVYKKYHDLFQTGKPIEDLKYVFYTKTGEERVLEGYVNTIRKENRIIGFQGTLRDITERKAAEEKLIASEERYRDLVENIEDIVYVFDGKGNTIFFNKASEKSLGYSKDELYKMNYKEYITPESYKMGREIFKRELSGEDVGVVEYQFYNKKGEIITVETRERLVWKDGKVVEIHGIGRNITERKKAEEELRESEERYRNLVETSKDGIVVVQDGKIVFINKIFTELSEYSEEEILGESFDKFIDPESLDNVVENYRKRLSGEEAPQTYELNLVDKSGQLIHAETNAALISWYGKPSILSFIRDITERKQTEEALIASERNYREIFNATNEAIFVHDNKTGAILDVNKSMCDMFEYTYEEVLNLTLEDLSFGESPYTIEDAVKWIKKAREEGPQLFEWYSKKKSGELFWAEVNLKHSNIGGKYSILAVVRDITDRKRVEEELRASEEKYRTILENIDDGYFEVDLAGNFTFFNDSMCKILGYSQSEMLGMNNRYYMDKEIAKDVYIVFNEVFSTKKAKRSFDWELIRKDKSRAFVSTSVSPIIDTDENVVGFRGIARDITERKQAEQKIREINERMEATFNALPDIFFEVDRHGRIYDYRTPNPELLYADPEEFLGKRLDEFIPEEQSKIVMEAIGEAIETGRHVGAVYSLSTPTGVSFFELSIAAKGDPKTEDLRLICLVRDITKRKKAEESLKESEELFRTLIQTAASVILCLSLDGKITEFNKEAELVYGYKRKDVIGKDYLELFIPNEIREEIVADIEEVLKGEPTRGFENSIIRVDGSERILSWNVNRLLDALGKPVGIIAAGHDITDRKRMEEALRKSEEKYRFLSENIPDIIYSMDKNFNLEYLNETGLKLGGYELSDVIGKPFAQLIHPDDREIVLNSFLEAFKTKGERIIGLEFRVCAKDKSIYWVELNSNIQFDEDGNYLREEGVLRDITEKVKAEDALKYSEERFKNIAENAMEWIWEVDKNGRYVYSSPVVEEILGYKPEEMLDKHFYDIFDQEEREEKKKAAFEIFEKKLPFREFINRCAHKNGHLVWISTSGVPIIDDKGGLIGYRGADTDITENKKAEELLKESEKRYRELVENIEDIIYVLDGEGKFKFINRTLEKNLGYNTDDVLNSNFKDFLTPDSYEYSEKLFGRMLEGEDFEAFEIEFYDKDGRIRIIETRMQPIWEKGRIVELSGIGRDITERKKIEKQLIQAQKMEAVGALAGGMAHNFNNILVGIMGYSEFLISKRSEGDPDYEALKTIHEGTIRASFLTRELLNVARRGEYRPAKINLNHVVGKTLPLIAGTFDRSIEIETHLAEDLMIMEGDINQLEQSILNICINARDAMPRGGSITIGTYSQDIDSDFIRTHMDARKGNYVVLSITDTGIGMTQEVKERIFEPFFTTKEDKGGTGMGLSTVYGIVKSHGGLVTVYSEEGEGTTFRLYFPAIKGDLREVPEVEDDEKFIGSATILLVDDEQVVIDMWGDFLLHMGHHILTARDGEEALTVYKEEKEKIDLVILDYVMPKMGARDTLIALREIDPDVRVLVSSGYSENGHAKEIIAEGADGFIQKPAQLSELHKKIVEILQSKRKR